MRELWAQEKVRRGDLSIVKVKGENNVADRLTKHVDRSKLEKYATNVDSHSAMGDLSCAPTLEMFKFFVRFNWFNMFSHIRSHGMCTTMIQLELSLDSDQYWVEHGFNFGLTCG